MSVYIIKMHFSTWNNRQWKCTDKYWNRRTFNGAANETEYWLLCSNSATTASQSWQCCRVQKYSL